MKIFNAISGSFFRTIGRMLAYAFIGFILFLCFSKIKLPKINDISDTINWSWFFGVQKVNAKETTVQNNYTYYMNGNAMTLTHDSFFSYSDNLRSNGSQNICFNSNCSSSPLNVEGMDEIRFSIGVENNNDSTIRCVFNGEMIDARALYGNLQNPYHQDDAYTLIFDNDYYQYNSLNCTNVKNGSSILISASYDQGYLVNCNINNYFEGEGLETFFTVTCPVVKNQTTLNSINVQTGTYTIGVEIGSYITKIKGDGTQIIESQNQNAQNIINNQEANTNATIENQNQNTQQQIQSQQVCNNLQIDKTKIEIENKYLSTTGNEGSSSIGNGITSYIKIKETDILKMTLGTSDYNISICFYNQNKQLISCIEQRTIQVNTKITIPIYSYFFRATINKNTGVPTFYLESCENGNQAMSDTITDTSTSEADNKASGFFDNFTTSDQGGLSGIITAPLSAIQSITSATCSPLVIPLPFLENQNLSLPCMRSIYESFFGGFMTIYDTITLGIISYWVLVRLFNLVKDFKNPEHDEIEVVDL